MPTELEWLANLTNPNTRRAYQADVRGFLDFLGIREPENLRNVTRAHVLAWRNTIAYRIDGYEELARALHPEAFR